MLDSYLDDAPQYCDCMFGYELLESDEEGALEGNGTLDESQAGVRVQKLASAFQRERKMFNVRS